MGEFGLLGGMLGGGAGAGGAGLLGMLGGPWGMAAASFGLPLLSRLLGGGNRQNAAFNDWQQRRNALMSPNFLHDRMAQYLPMLSQMSQGQQGGILNNANAFQNTLAHNLASSGMNRTGIGALAATGASSMAATNLNNLESENRRGAMGMAFNDRDTMMNLLSSGPQSMENPWLDAIGQGSNSFMSYLMNRNRGSQGYYGSQGAGYGH